MRFRSKLVAVLTFVIVLGACGDSGTTGRSTQSSSDAPAATMSGAELDKLLLDAGDVGADWQVGSPVNEQDLSDSTQLPCPDAALNPTIAERLTPVGGIQFEPTDRSYKHMIEFVLTGDAQRLDRDLQILAGAMEACSTATATTSGTTGTLQVEKLAIPKLGEQRAAYVLTGRESAVSPSTWYVRSAVVRVGSVAISLGLTEILTAPQTRPEISDEAFVQLLEQAVAKLSG